MRSLKLITGCRYDDIRMLCIPLLVSALQDDTPEKTTWTRFCERVEGHFKGDLQHVTDTLSLLWKTVNQDGDSSSTIAFDGTPSVRLFLSHHCLGLF